MPCLSAGLPDDPEPECSLEELPIWRHHPDKQRYRRFPYMRLREQMRMVYQSKPREVTYDCFICGGLHTHGADPEPAAAPVRVAAAVPQQRGQEPEQGHGQGQAQQGAQQGQGQQEDRPHGRQQQNQQQQERGVKSEAQGQGGAAQHRRQQVEVKQETGGADVGRVQVKQEVVADEQAGAWEARAPGPHLQPQVQVEQEHARGQAGPAQAPAAGPQQQQQQSYVSIKQEMGAAEGQQAGAHEAHVAYQRQQQVRVKQEDAVEERAGAVRAAAAAVAARPQPRHVRVKEEPCGADDAQVQLEVGPCEQRYQQGPAFVKREVEAHEQQAGAEEAFSVAQPHTPARQQPWHAGHTALQAYVRVKEEQGGPGAAAVKLEAVRDECYGWL